MKTIGPTRVPVFRTEGDEQIPNVSIAFEVCIHLFDLCYYIIYLYLRHAIIMLE